MKRAEGDLEGPFDDEDTRDFYMTLPELQAMGIRSHPYGTRCGCSGFKYWFIIFSCYDHLQTALNSRVESITASAEAIY